MSSADIYPRSTKDYEGPRVTSTESFIQKATFIWGDTYEYGTSEYSGAKNKIKIVCRTHGEFLQNPGDHVSGNGCTKCRRESSYRKRSLSQEDFIEKSKFVHGSLYDYSKVEYVNNSKPVIIICKKHGEFKQKPSLHYIQKSGCPECGITKRAKKKWGEDTFIQKSKDTHGEYYSYDNVAYEGAHTKVAITCPVHGDFLQSPTSHLSGSGCPLCARHKGNATRIEIMDDIEKNKKYFIYIIEVLSEDGEVFHKIGTTMHEDIEKRYPKSRYKNFNITHILKKEGRKEDILLLEIEILQKMEDEGSRFKFTKFKDSFPGWSECYRPGEFDPMPHISSMPSFI